MAMIYPIMVTPVETQIPSIAPVAVLRLVDLSSNKISAFIGIAEDLAGRSQ